MADPDSTLTGLQILNARSLSAAGSAKPLSAGVHQLAGAGVVPGALVFDTVTGQVVEVVAAGVAYVPDAALTGVSSGE